MDVIAHLVKHHPKLIVGAGTVLDVETASSARMPERTSSPLRDSIATLSPSRRARPWFHARRIDANRDRCCVRAGADFAKVFPAVQVGGDGTCARSIVRCRKFR